MKSVARRVLARFIEASLRPADKRVVEAFVRKEALDGSLLETDGRSLNRNGMGHEKVAVWRGSKIAVVSTESSRTDQTILRYLVKVAGKNLVTWSYDRPGFERSLMFQTGGDSFSRDQYDGWIVAYVPGRDAPVGRLDWSTYQDKYMIKMVEVDPEFRRSGIATELYRKFFRDEGVTKRDLVPTLQTEEGSQFRQRARLARCMSGHAKPGWEP